MENEITLNFKNIAQEIKEKQLKLCLIKDKSWFIIDNQENLYQIEDYWHGSYLDRLIKDGTIVNFNLVDTANIEDWEKEIWGVSEVKAFMKK